jgi:hypothetical protein
MKKKGLMKPEIIKSIFTNLLFVIGVVLMVVGFIKGTATVANSIVFDQYPLDEWQETRCTIDMSYQDPALLPADVTPTETKESFEQRKDECKQALDATRRTKQVSDITYSFSFFVSGCALALGFKRFIFNG